MAKGGTSATDHHRHDGARSHADPRRTANRNLGPRVGTLLAHRPDHSTRAPCLYRHAGADLRGCRGKTVIGEHVRLWRRPHGIGVLDERRSGGNLHGRGETTHGINNQATKRQKEKMMRFWSPSFVAYLVPAVIRVATNSVPISPSQSSRAE